MKAGDRVQLISVPDYAKDDLNKFGIVVKVKDNTPHGRNVDVVLDEDNGISVVFDHQLKIIERRN